MTTLTNETPAFILLLVAPKEYKIVRFQKFKGTEFILELETE